MEKFLDLETVLNLSGKVSIAQSEPEPVKISTQRRKYILTKSGVEMSVAGVDGEQIRHVVNITIDMLKVILESKLLNLTYTHQRRTNFDSDIKKYVARLSSPVMLVNIDVQCPTDTIKQGYLRVTFNELCGNRRYFTIPNTAAAVEILLMDLGKISRRLL